ncbi:MAG: nucleoside deaminase [Holosporales bacterium]|jgi:tRNA(adenine34) deaminase|nr:nucleoside deaminase [Holosporales bacterium]
MYSSEIMEFVISSSEQCSLKEVPVCAVIAIDSDVVVFANNEVEKNNRPWLHAEFIAVQKSCEILGVKYLDKASLYVNLEPCAFCAAILEKVRIQNIFFGAYDIKYGAIDHNARIFDHSLVKPNIVGGIQEDRCSQIMRKFFKNLRD